MRASGQKQMQAGPRSSFLCISARTRGGAERGGETGVAFWQRAIVFDVLYTPRSDTVFGEEEAAMTSDHVSRLRSQRRAPAAGTRRRVLLRLVTSCQQR
jgi:hypothetical protein